MGDFTSDHALNTSGFFGNREYSCQTKETFGEWVSRKEKEAYKEERDKMLFDAALAIATHSTLSIGGAFDRAESFIKEYERRVNCQKD